MGILDWLRGTQHPAVGVSARSPQEVREALLAVNSADVPYLVRDGSREGVDLVAEWKITDAHWYSFFGHVTRANKTLMRLVSSTHDVRAVDHQITVTWSGRTPRLVLSKEVQRGQINTVSYNAVYGRDAHGRLVRIRHTTFSTGALKPPLREAVTSVGWTWRGVLIRRL